MDKQKIISLLAEELEGSPAELEKHKHTSLTFPSPRI